MGRHAKNVAEQRFGNLVAKRPVGFIGKRYSWECLCDCGNLCTRQISYLTQKYFLQTCGCIPAERRAAILRPVLHGKTGTPEHRAYCGARSRCNNPDDKSYPDYGGRGIKFTFESFEQFLAELGPRPVAFDAKGRSLYSLDRKENDGNYAPGNVRWATREEQNSNQRHGGGRKAIPVPY